MVKKIFISDKCPDCRLIIDLMSKKDIGADVINITDSMINLKEFLQYRDNFKEFEEVRKNNKVGIPMIVDEDNKIKFLSQEDIENL